ncbi:MAG: hypothetical protein ACP5VE_06460 [Chthonomonadales bacterium]
MRASDELIAKLKQARVPAAVVGLAGTALCVVGALGSWEQFLQCYLFAYVLWMGITLGCMALMMLHHMVKSRWGLPIVRPAEAGAGNLWFMALLFLPIAAGLGALYPWAKPALVASSTILKHKQPYLNVPFFMVRAVIYFGIWMGLTAVIRRLSVQQDQNGDLTLADRRASWAAPGLVAYVVTVTFAFTDWVMSLHPSWYSTIFGFWFVMSQGMSGLCFLIVFLTLVRRYAPFEPYATPGGYRDLGNLLLTFVMFWGYLSLSQFLIIYSGNLPDEASYYLTRMQGIWWAIGTFLVLFQFFVPFLLLLSGRTKRTPVYLGSLAAFLLAVRAVDMFWTVLPFFPIPATTLPLGYVWMGLAAFAAIGGWWVVLFLTALPRALLVPIEVPGAAEVLEHA